MVSFVSSIAAGIVAALTLGVPARAAPDHFVLTEVNTLVQARIDPIINNGKVGSHMHNIMGASNFGTTLKHPNDLIGGAQCTTVLVNDDKSNYWTPTLYYMHDNGTYEAMLAGARIYYFLKSEKVQPWPKGMRIVSGTAMSRDESAIQSLGVDLTCGETMSSRHLPNGTSHGYCDSIHAGIYFPSCGWANQSLDSWDHFSHLTWPIQRGGGREWVDVNGEWCPDSHPIKYPTMFIQHFYRFDEHRPWRKGRNNVVFSNGDTLGTSFHGDFVNGWKDGALESIINGCKKPNGPGEDLKKCAPIAKSLSIENARNCAYQGMIPNEEVGIYRAIDKLPGCNPLWPANAGDEKPKCDNPGPTPGWVKPNIGFMRGFQIRLPLYIPDIKAPSELKWNWNGWMSSGVWGVYGSDNSTIQRPDNQGPQAEQPSDSIAGSPVNNGGAVFDQETPLDAPVILDSQYATFPAGVTGTPVVLYKDMPSPVDVLGNNLIDTGAKQKAKAPQPTAVPEFGEKAHASAFASSAASDAAASASPDASSGAAGSSGSGNTASESSAAPSAAATPSPGASEENATWTEPPTPKKGKKCRHRRRQAHALPHRRRLSKHL